MKTPETNTHASSATNPDAVFDEGVKRAFLSPKGVRMTQEINTLAEKVGE